jgi:hypothetical protein
VPVTQVRACASGAAAPVHLTIVYIVLIPQYYERNGEFCSRISIRVPRVTCECRIRPNMTTGRGVARSTSFAASDPEARIPE